MSMQIVDFIEGPETDAGKEPDRIVYICGSGQEESVTKKELFIAIKQAKKFGILGRKPGVVPMSSAK